MHWKEYQGVFSGGDYHIHPRVLSDDAYGILKKLRRSIFDTKRMGTKQARSQRIRIVHVQENYRLFKRD